jgi:hypothetical protein
VYRLGAHNVVQADARLIWIRPPESLSDDFERWGNKLVDNAFNVAKALAADWESYAKAFGSWEDQTGEARRRLEAFAIREGAIITIILRHGVFYGFFLETMQGGRFAIIGPSTPLFGKRMMERLNGIGSR